MDYKDINDYELLYMVCDGSDDYLNIIFSKYKSLIDNKIIKWKWICGYLGYDFDDLKQDLNILLIDAIRNFDPCKDVLFYTYFNKYVDNYFCDKLRKYKYYRKYDFKVINEFNLIDDDEVSLFDNISSSDDSLIGNSLIYEIEEKIKDICYSLPINQAMIFELNMNGYSIPEITVLSELDRKYIYNVLHRVRKKIREKY